MICLKAVSESERAWFKARRALRASSRAERQISRWGILPACLKTDHSSREARLIAGPEGDFTYLGQVQNSYLVCEKSGEVIFMDQHAAHERILFEKIKKDWQTQKLEKQSLLIPLQLELS